MTINITINTGIKTPRTCLSEVRSKLPHPACGEGE